jgi:preprotein translocase subunit YajC
LKQACIKGPEDKEFRMFVSPAYAQVAGGGGLGGIGQFIPLILIFAIMYFLLIRPQQKKAKAHRAMVDALRRGDQVVTAGGMFGKVTKVKEDGEVEVEIASGVKVRVVQSTISSVISKTEPVEK